MAICAPGRRRGRGRRHAGAGAGNAHVPAVGQRRGRRAPAARTDPIAGHAGQRPGIGSQAGQLDPALHHGAAPVGAAVRGRRLRQPVAAGQRILSFDGDVALSASQSLRFYAGSYAVTDRAMAARHVSLSAPHLRWPARRAGDGVTPTVTWRDGASARPGVGSFTADADLIDIRDRVGFGARGAVPLLAGAPVTVDRRGFDQVSLNSRGDVRLLGGQAGRGLVRRRHHRVGHQRDLRITSAQLYPATGASATIWGGYEPAAAWKSCASPARVGGVAAVGVRLAEPGRGHGDPGGHRARAPGLDQPGPGCPWQRQLARALGRADARQPDFVSGAGVMVPMAARRMA